MRHINIAQEMKQKNTIVGDVEDTSFIYGESDG